jgi:hypothetical protein
LITIRIGFKSSLSLNYIQYADQLQQGLIEYCRAWSLRRLYAYLILDLIIQRKIESIVSLGDFEYFNSQNYYTRLLLFGEPYKCKKKKMPDGSISEIKHEFDLTELNQTVEFLKRTEILPEIPSLNGKPYYRPASLLAVSFQSEVKSLIKNRYIKIQRKAILSIVKSNSAMFVVDGLNLNQPKDLELLVIFIQKKINNWTFVHELDLRIKSPNEHVKNLIDQFKSILPSSHNQKDVYGVTNTILNSMKPGDLLYSVVRMSQLLVVWNAQLIKIIPKVHNRNAYIPFDNVAFRKVFKNLLPIKSKAFEMFDFFDRTRFRSGSQSPHFYFKTNGLVVNMVFENTKSPIVHIINSHEQSTAALRLTIVILIQLVDKNQLVDLI